MAGYTKLFGSILHSTVWHTPGHVRLVWITMLAMSDRDGIVEASVPGLAIAARVERSQCEQALAMFLAPDPDSRTKAFEGRRIEEVDGGWRLLNHAVYRERASADEQREKSAIRMRRKRERDAAVTPRVTQSDAPSRAVTPGDGPSREVRHAEAEAEAEAEADTDQRERERAHAPARVLSLMQGALRQVGIVPADLTGSRWSVIGEWVLTYVELHPTRNVAEVCLSLARGFHANAKAKKAGYPLGFLSKNPMEYLDRESTAPALRPEDYDGVTGSTRSGTLADPLPAIMAERSRR